MKSFLIILITFIFLACSNESSHKDIKNNIILNCKNALTDNKLMIMAGYNSTFFDEKYTGNVESPFDNNPNQLEWILQYENGKIIKYESFYPNGNKELVRPIRCNSNHGECKYYNEDGILIYSFNYYLGRKDGLAKVYYPNGKLKRKLMYKNDVEQGNLYEFNQNGDSTIIAVFKNGVKIKNVP